MSWHAVCPDGFVRPENNGCAWDHGHNSEKAARDQAAAQDWRVAECLPMHCCCAQRGHRVEQGIRVRASE